jgi:metallo-beta-lactamase family protein
MKQVTGGKILVPVFAVGRAQMLLYLLAGAFQRGMLPSFPIYIDSPMAIEATKIYSKYVELFDEEAQAMQKSGELCEQLDTVELCRTADQSRTLNRVNGPCLIMAEKKRGRSSFFLTGGEPLLKLQPCHAQHAKRREVWSTMS